MLRRGDPTVVICSITNQYNVPWCLAPGMVSKGDVVTNSRRIQHPIRKLCVDLLCCHIRGGELSTTISVGNERLGRRSEVIVSNDQDVGRLILAPKVCKLHSLHVGDPLGIIWSSDIVPPTTQRIARQVIAEDKVSARCRDGVDLDWVGWIGHIQADKIIRVKASHPILSNSTPGWRIEGQAIVDGLQLLPVVNFIPVEICRRILAVFVGDTKQASVVAGDLVGVDRVKLLNNPGCISIPPIPAECERGPKRDPILLYRSTPSSIRRILRQPYPVGDRIRSVQTR